MQKRILEFANILRKSGIRVSTAEALEALAKLEEETADVLDALLADSANHSDLGG